MRSISMALMAVVCACGGKDKPIPTCEEMVAGLKSQLVENTVAVWTERCHADHWSDEIRRCFRYEVGYDCIKQLTDQQRGALMKHTMNASTRDNERTQLARYATDAFPRWASTHPSPACPEKLTELDPQLTKVDYLTSGDKDEWGHARKILCGDALPKQVKGLGVVSMGPDGVEGNADDVHSWDPAP